MRIKRWWRRRNIVICLFAAFQFSFSFSFPSRPGVFAPHLAGRQGFLFGEKEAEQKADDGPGGSLTLLTCGKGVRVLFVKERGKAKDG